MSPPGCFKNREAERGSGPPFTKLFPSYHILLLGNFSSFSIASILGLSSVHLSQIRTGFCCISELVTAPRPQCATQGRSSLRLSGPRACSAPARFPAARAPETQQPRHPAAGGREASGGKQGSTTVSDGPPSFGWQQQRWGGCESQDPPLLLQASSEG